MFFVCSEASRRVGKCSCTESHEPSLCCCCSSTMPWGRILLLVRLCSSGSSASSGAASCFNVRERQVCCFISLGIYTSPLALYCSIAHGSFPSKLPGEGRKQRPFSTHDSRVEHGSRLLFARRACAALPAALPLYGRSSRPCLNFFSNIV